MKNLKIFLMAAMMLLTLNVTTTIASNLNEIQFNYDGDKVVLTLEIPDAGVNVEIELPQSTFDAPVTIELEGSTGLVVIDINGLNSSISGDGINARSISGDGINALISGDGINARSISGDGINALISGDGINALISGDGINARVSQSGSVLFSGNF